MCSDPLPEVNTDTLFKKFIFILKPRTKYGSAWYLWVGYGPLL